MWTDHVKKCDTFAVGSHLLRIIIFQGPDGDPGPKGPLGSIGMRGEVSNSLHSVIACFDLFDSRAK